MAFKRFIQVGRVCLISYGEHADKLCVVVDILDQSHVVVDAPAESSVPRHVINVKRLKLTDIVVKLPRACKTKTVRKALEMQQAVKRFEESSWGKKLQRQQVRARLSDFDRFRVMIARKRRSQLIGQELGRLRSETRATAS
jgi:large subunit ribosomal protein L14e